jgi:hypothetical protein
MFLSHLQIDQIATLMSQQQKEQLPTKQLVQSYKFYLEQDLLKARNPAVAKKIDEESALFHHIPYHDLLQEELIGQGGFADVYRGVWISHNDQVAIKVIRVQHLNENVKQVRKF